MSWRSRISVLIALLAVGVDGLISGSHPTGRGQCIRANDSILKLQHDDTVQHLHHCSSSGRQSITATRQRRQQLLQLHMSDTSREDEIRRKVRLK